MAIDPICGMTVDEATARSAERDGQTFYFCSEHCRQKFLGSEPTEKPQALPTITGHHHKPAPSGRHQDKYVCPMHPEVESDKPGSCPKCGMALEPARPAAQKQKVIYTCPMHPEIEQDGPGTCPKCGMDSGAEDRPAGRRGGRLRTAEHDPPVLGRRRLDRAGAAAGHAAHDRRAGGPLAGKHAALRGCNSCSVRRWCCGAAGRSSSGAGGPSSPGTSTCSR